MCCSLFESQSRSRFTFCPLQYMPNSIIVVQLFAYSSFHYWIFYCPSFFSDIVETKKQYAFSRSSTKVEYTLMTMTCCKVKWLLYLLKGLCISLILLVHLHFDNQVVVFIAFYLVYHERTKNISFFG